MKKNIQPRRSKALIAFAMSVVGWHAFGETQTCDDRLASYSNRSCLLKSLREADEHLNEVYQRKLQGSHENDQRELRDAQRRWITRRNSTCQIDEKQNNVSKGDWIIALAGDPMRAKCVLQHTTARTAELESEKKATQTRKPAILFRD